MAFDSENNRSGPYACDGVTVLFPVTFYFTDDDHLQVVLTDADGNETTLTKTTNYSVAGVGSNPPSGSITTTAIYPTGSTITIVPDLPFTQESIYPETGRFPAKTNEGDHDLSAQRDLQLLELMGRAIKLPVSSSLTNLEAPPPLASAVWGWNNTADGLTNYILTDLSAYPVTPFVTTLFDDPDASTFLSTLGFSTFIKTLIDDTSASAALSTLGFSTFIKTLIDDADAPTARATLDAEQRANSLSAVTPVAADSVIIADASDSGNSKKALLSDILALAGSGGFVNLFLNGAMDIWQDGTSGTITGGAAPAYTADGWMINTEGANGTWSQVAGNATTKFGLRLTGNTSLTTALFEQRIESFLGYRCYPGAPARVTVQIKCTNLSGAAIIPTLTVDTPNAPDNWSAFTNVVNAVALQSCPDLGTTVVSYTFDSTVGFASGFRIRLNLPSGCLNSNAKSFTISECDVRITPGVATGQNNSPPKPELRHVHSELLFAQRYYPVYNPGNNTLLGNGQSTSGTSGQIGINFPVETRIPVTGLTVSSAGHFAVFNPGASRITCSSVALNVTFIPNTKMAMLEFQVASGLTAGDATMMTSQNASAKLAFTGARL